MTDPIPTITPVTTVPNRSEATSNTAFRIAVSQFLATMAPLSTEFNLSIDGINAAIEDISEGLALLSSSVDSASISAQTAQDVYEALAAASLAELVGGSGTSVAIGLGTQSFTAPPNKLWTQDTALIIRSAANAANFMVGAVTSYNVSNGALSVLVDKTGGSGSFTDWLIYPAPPRYVGTLRIGDIVRTYAPRSGFLATDGSYIQKATYPDLWNAMFGSRAWPGYLRPPVGVSPGNQPGGSAAVAWRPDGSKFAVAHFNSPYVALYNWNGGDPVKLADPATLPAGTGRSAGWSPDGRYLAVGHDTTPFLSIYDWNTGSPIKIANPATLPAASVNAVCWSPSFRYLACAHGTSPYVTIYDFFTGSPVKIANPATLPTNTGSALAWSPDGRYLAVGHSNSPYLTIYDWQSGSPVKIADPASLPSSGVTRAAWSPDSRYLAVLGGASPTIYDMNTGAAVLTGFSAPSLTSVSFIGWMSDGAHLAFANSSSIVLYSWSGGVATLLDAAYDTAGNAIGAAAIAPNDDVVAMAINASPYLQILQLEGAPADLFPLPTITTTKPATYIKATA